MHSIIRSIDITMFIPRCISNICSARLWILFCCQALMNIQWNLVMNATSYFEMVLVGSRNTSTRRLKRRKNTKFSKVQRCCSLTFKLQNYWSKFLLLREKKTFFILLQEVFQQFHEWIFELLAIFSQFYHNLKFYHRLRTLKNLFGIYGKRLTDNFVSDFVSSVLSSADGSEQN